MSSEKEPSSEFEGLKRRSMENAAWLIIISDDSPTLQDLLMRLSDPKSKAATAITDDPVELSRQIANEAERLAIKFDAGLVEGAESVASEIGIAIGDLLNRLLKLAYQNGIDPLRAAGNRLH